MSDLNYLELYAKLCGFRTLTLANRLGCTNEVAQRTHDELLERLSDLVDLMRDIMQAQRELLHTADPIKREELEWAFTSCESHLDNVWLTSTPCPLLEFVAIDPETREYRDHRTGYWHALTEDGPYLCDVSDAELCGLRSIIDQITRETGICFSAYRVVWGGRQIDEEAS
jgi:hypothetical protein